MGKVLTVRRNKLVSYTQMENYNEDNEEEIDIEQFDRMMRSYITAMLLSEEQEMENIAINIIETSNNAEYALLMLSSYGAMTCYLLSLLANSTKLEEIFAVWSGISQEIEMETILGPEI